MSNRFTQTDKWDDIWFKALKPLEKLCFNFLCDRCDLAGFYELDLDDMSYRIKSTENEILGAVQGLNRGLILEKGGLIQSGSFVWVKNFLYHQRNLPLNPNNNAHASILFHISTRLDKFPNIPKILGADEGLFSSYGKGISKSKGKGPFLTDNIIVINISERIEKFKAEIESYILANPEYRPVKNEFIKYWTEKNKSGSKFRYEKESFFDIGKRLGTFLKNSSSTKFSSDNAILDGVEHM